MATHFKVINLNDNAPRISMQYLTDSGGASVTLERLVKGDFIARFSVTDEDESGETSAESGTSGTGVTVSYKLLIPAMYCNYT